MTDDEMIVRTRKPVKCPACGHRPVADIYYGLFTEPSPALQKKIDAGLVVFGGCTVFVDAPFDKLWECSRCGEQIYRKARPE